MEDKKDIYMFLTSIIDQELVSKTDLLEVFVNVLKDHFSVEEMFGIVGGSYLPQPKNKEKIIKANEVMSYPSVSGIPISLIYERLFKK